MERVNAGFYPTVETGIRPVSDILDPTMFDGVVVDVVEMVGIVGIVTNRVFPKAPLPEVVFVT